MLFCHDLIEEIRDDVSVNIKVINLDKDLYGE